jgi:hypothetical protein
MTSHLLRTAGAAGLLALACANLPVAAVAADTEALIKNALSAAPPAVAADAKVMNMKGEVLRDGKGAFTCFPFEGPGTGTDAMCVDDEFMRWAGAWMSKSDFKAEKVGLAYMLAGDSPTGGASNIDPFATAATPDNHWVIEGPHVMIITPDAAALDALPDDPNSGGPYVMWKGTPYAHIMMPVGPRP